MLLRTLEHLFPGFDPLRDCELRGDGGEPVIHAWYRSEPQPTDAELKAAEPAALAAAQAEEAKRIESHAARDDAKRALLALDTIITGIDGATLTQAKTAIRQLAQIQRHIILATLGR